MVLWLSKDLGFNDQQAGAITGWVWAPAMTIFTLLAGSLTDAIGLRKTFFLGITICTFARTVMITSTTPWVAFACGLLPLAIGEALGTPVLLAATRRYSTAAQRTISFAIIYGVMNIGYTAAGYIIDYVKPGKDNQPKFDVNLFGFHPTAWQQLFIASLILEVLLFPIVYFLRRGAESITDGIKIDQARAVVSNFWSGITQTLRKGATDTAVLFRRLIAQPNFYRLLVFFIFIGFLKAIFLQMDYVFPKFGLREWGPGAPIGKIQNINSISIIFLAPLVGALTQKIATYRMVVIGALICATAVFIMALPPTWFESAANSTFAGWFGHGYLRLQGSIHPYYVMSALYLVMFSIGEAFYSPRTYQYAAAIAPQGQEASYGSLAFLPFLFGKVLTGAGGWLLATFCPENGICRVKPMWIIIALAASIAPIGLLIFRRFIQVQEAGREN
jgi:MFS family permease